MIGSVESKKIDLLKLMGVRLGSLHSRDALLLLCHSFAIPKVLYILQTPPCFLSSQSTSNFRQVAPPYPNDY